MTAHMGMATEVAPDTPMSAIARAVARRARALPNQAGDVIPAELEPIDTIEKLCVYVCTICIVLSKL